MADGYQLLILKMRSQAKEMKTMAADSLKSDAHPEFWIFATDLSTRWLEALEQEPVDWRVLGALREEARSEKHRAGVWLFTHCNAIERDYAALREASLLSLASDK